MAEEYERSFVPAFFAQWAPLVCDAAGLGVGDQVLDVACGTGIVARTAAERVGPAGRVTGVDLNPAMLEVARRVRPDLDFRQADAAALPFAAHHFDAVLCQMALMFFPDRDRAIAEMGRVVREDRPVVLLVPADLRDQPGFTPFAEVVSRHAGPTAVELVGSYFTCGDPDELSATIVAAGLTVQGVSRHDGIYRAPSVEAMVRTEVESTPLIERIDEDTYARIRADAVPALAPFTAAGRQRRRTVCVLLATARRG